MNELRESVITINGNTLTPAQAMTIRVACSDFSLWLAEPFSLGDERHGIAMRENYLRLLGEIFEMMRIKP